MQIYSISEGAQEGATVSAFVLKSGDMIPAIIVGQSGRGRSQGVLPVQLLPQSHAEWQEKASVKISFARVGETRAGNPRLIQEPGIGEIDRFIAVFRTPIGFRGGNSHTGDRGETRCTPDYYLAEKLESAGIKLPAPANGKFYTKKEACTLSAKVYSPEEGDTAGFKVEIDFLPFPQLHTLSSGGIAQGDAGGMGSGSQLVSVMPVGKVFRTGISGRRYGNPNAYYYLHDGDRLMCATWADRELADLW